MTFQTFVAGLAQLDSLIYDIIKGSARCLKLLAF